MLKELVGRMRGQKDDPRTVYVGSHEDKLAGIRPVHVDDDAQPTREDVEAATAAKRPPSGSFG